MADAKERYDPWSQFGHSLCAFRKARSRSLDHRKTVRFPWHNLFLPSVLGRGPLTPVQDFTRQSVRLMDVHLVFRAFARHEPRESQVSHIARHSFPFFFSSLRVLPSRFFPQYLNALCPGCHRSQENSRATVHFQSHRHPATYPSQSSPQRRSALHSSTLGMLLGILVPISADFFPSTVSVSSSR